MLLAGEREEIAGTCRRMLRDGLVTGTAGNVSVRVGDLVAITPTGTPYESLTAEDVVVVGPDGGAAEGSRAPSAELPMHLAIYAAFPGTRAIVHTHSGYATSVGTVLDELPAVHYAINALGGPVRVAPYATFGTGALAAAVTRALDGRSAALLRNHGAVAVGESLASAYDRAVRLEWLSEVYWRAALLGTPSVLTAGELAAARDQAARTAYHS
ncbi:MAG TPA: class II aldolase/adducin family protein [Mycobacteriales bacterium]